MKCAYMILSADQKVLEFKGHGMFGGENLKKSIQAALQFFSIAEGDVIILNDPSVGGFFPWAVTAIHRVGSHCIARSLRVPMPWVFSDKVDAESLRIPPTPLVQKGVLQQEIYQILISHPLAGPHLQSALLELVRRDRVIDLMPLSLTQPNSALTQPNSALTQPNSASAQPNSASVQPTSASVQNSYLKRLLLDLPSSESSAEAKLSTGEILKLKLETSEKGFTFDFSATSAGQKCFLNETLVQALCHEYISHFFNLAHPYNLELNTITEFLTSRASFLQAKFPQGQLHGLARGSAAVWHVIQKCFQTIYSRQVLPQHQFFSLWLQIQGAQTFDQWILPCGTGASEKEQGHSAMNLNGISLIPSPDQIQNHFEIDNMGLAPIQFQTRINAGQGLQLQLRAKSDLKLLWISEDASQIMKSHPKYAAMEPSSIIYRSEKLPAFGELTIKSGEALHIQTGTGSGLL